MSSEYKSEIDLRVDWADLDLFGHVNNVAFFKYMQAGRLNYCENLGLSSVDVNKLSFMVASSHCQFKKSLKYPGHIKVFTKVDWLKNSSFQLNHLILDHNSEICAEGQDVLVVYDHVKKREGEYFDRAP